MKPTATEVEKLVRQALQAWTGSVASSSVSAIPVASVAAIPAASPSADARELVLMDSVISTECLRGRTGGIASLRVPPRSILTPAVKDLCREKGIAIVRDSGADQSATHQAIPVPLSSQESSPSPGSRPQRLVMAGTSPWMSAIEKQLCPKQAKVLARSTDDAAALRSIQESLGHGHQAGILWVESAYATGWQAARIESLRPAVVTQWSDVTRALREVPLNLLVLPIHGWSIPAVCNAARTVFEHLKRTN
ncbi:hypothetical protein VN12_07455 [Pirellula sp. SH-Sr6A]|uniref:hypothetical protein n=1 Tax=Pirellula sp. SH-Sr6A TaxID=1632865 RepID=UPI00078EF5BC|nr:hypothetical protein [Pirellula sp. SH-Sr6A]AMV31941.1 hypothetical protein VN12_07455 [Pirellula sp. SH-Sr6A]